MLKNNDYIENNNFNKKNKKSKKSKIKKVSKEIILDSIFKSLKKNWIWYVSVIISCFILNLDNLNSKFYQKNHKDSPCQVPRKY